MLVYDEEINNCKDTLIKKFLSFFDGYEKAFFTFQRKENNNNFIQEKVETNNFLVAEPLNEKNVLGHFRGIKGIAVIPLKNNNSVKFACIDVDDYTIDLYALEERIINNELPLLLCRSKSGGAHLFIFFKEERRDVESVVKLLDHYAKDILGLKKYEIFPKQKCRVNDNDIGSGINLPYFRFAETVSGNTCDEYCINNGKVVPLNKFIELCEAVSVDSKITKDLIVSENRMMQEMKNRMMFVNPEYHDAPPCIIQIFTNRIDSGERNNALFSVGVYLKKKFPDDWSSRLSTLNQLLCVKPLDEQSLENNIIKTLNKKDYFYKCNDLPLKLYCNKAACKKCKFGIFNVQDNSNIISNLVCMKNTAGVFKGSNNSIYWFLTIKDIYKVKLTTQQLNNVSMLKQCIQEQVGVNINLKKEEWEARLNELFVDLETVEVGDSYSEKEVFLSIFNEYLLKKSSPSIEAIMKGKVLEYEEMGVKKLGFKFDKFFEYYRDRIKTKEGFDSLTIFAIFSSIGVKEARMPFICDNEEVILTFLSIDRKYLEKEILLREKIKKFDEDDSSTKKMLLNNF